MSDATAIAQAPLPRTLFSIERTPPREGAIDRILIDLQARIRPPFARTRARWLGRIVAVADSFAEPLRRLSDDELRAEARRIRLSLLSRAKPRRDDIAFCFALIREAAERILGQRHYGVQLIGGYALLRGVIAEMENGAGKSLTVTPAAIPASPFG